MNFSQAALAGIAALGLWLDASPAHAIDRHERLSARPIRKNGKVIGAMLKLTLMPEQYSTTRVGIGPISRPNGDHRAAASDLNSGYLLHQFSELTGLKGPREVELELLYGDRNKLMGGETVEVISAWQNPSRPSYWHVYGLQSITSDRDTVVRLPSDRPESMVTFKVRASTNEGENIMLAGSDGNLGAWNTKRAVKMTPSECVGKECTWTVTVPLYQGSANELKFMRVPRYGAPTWESGANRTVNVGTDQAIELDGGSFQ